MEIRNLYNGALVCDPACPDVIFRIWRKNEEGTYLMADNVLRQMCFDAAEPGRRFGNNDYALSNIRQYLNAEGMNWFRPQHENDTPPTRENIYDGDNPYVGLPGFLTGFSEGFKAAILTAAVESRDRDGNLRILNDRVFLPSATEMGFHTSEGMEEGEKLPLANDPRMRIAAPTAEAVATATWKPAFFGVDKPWNWLLRSPSSGHAYSVRVVDSGGSENNYLACDGRQGLRPALILKSDTLVSNQPDQRGVYRLTA